MLRRELEPGEEVEGLAEIAPVMKAPRDRRQVLHPYRDMVRGFLEDLAPLDLRELPPLLRLGNWDERRAGGRWTTEWLLPAGEGLMLLAVRVLLVANGAPEYPGGVRWQLHPSTLDDGDTRSVRKRGPDDWIDAVHGPQARVAANEAGRELHRHGFGLGFCQGRLVIRNTLLLAFTDGR